MPNKSNSSKGQGKGTQQRPTWGSSVGGRRVVQEVPNSAKAMPKRTRVLDSAEIDALPDPTPTKGAGKGGATKQASKQPSAPQVASKQATKQASKAPQVAPPSVTKGGARKQAAQMRETPAQARARQAQEEEAAQEEARQAQEQEAKRQATQEARERLHNLRDAYLALDDVQARYEEQVRAVITLEIALGPNLSAKAAQMAQDKLNKEAGL